MRRSASEIIRNLERRIARLEGKERSGKTLYPIKRLSLELWGFLTDKITSKLESVNKGDKIRNLPHHRKMKVLLVEDSNESFSLIVKSKRDTFILDMEDTESSDLLEYRKGAYYTQQNLLVHLQEYYRDYRKWSIR